MDGVARIKVFYSICLDYRNTSGHTVLTLKRTFVDCSINLTIINRRDNSLWIELLEWSYWMNYKIREQLGLRVKLAEVVLNNSLLHEQIDRAFLLLSLALKFNNKILIFGNGGSAAEAQHFAAELVCMFEKNRRAFPAIALTTDSSILTAQSN